MSDPQLRQVRPGDLITAEMFNRMMALIQALAEQAGEQPIGPVVPDLVSLSVAQAQALLTSGFTLGVAVDAFGVSVNPNLSSNRTRIVLNQTPPAGTRLAEVQPINLVLNALPSSTAPNPAPTITGFNLAGQIRVGQPLQIFGTNFAPAASANSVTIDGVDAQVQPTQSNPGVGRLVVIVPELPTPPPPEGRVVVVVVTTASGTASSASLPETARPRVFPAASNQPRITDLIDIASGQRIGAGGTLTVSRRVRIEGENFSPVADRNDVSFRIGVNSTPAIIEDAGPSAIEFLVPRLPSHSPTNESVAASLVVTVESDDDALETMPLSVFVELP